MLYFIADARDGAAKSGCNVCCCEAATARPGEVNKVEINYAQWSLVTAEKGLSFGTAIEISPCTNCGEASSIATDAFARTLTNTDYVGTLADPVATGSLLYQVLAIYGPRNGEVTAIDAGTGAFTYRPNPGFTGIDRLFFKVTDEDGGSSIGEFIISVDPVVGAQNRQPGFENALSIPAARVNIDRKSQTLSFPLDASPKARPGDIYRITIRQPAIDCDCAKFWHSMCLDVTITKC